MVLHVLKGGERERESEREREIYVSATVASWTR